MKQIICLFAVVLTHSVFGWHAGVGLAWNTIDETFHSNLVTNQNRSGRDRYETHMNRLAPVAKVGHQFFLHHHWIVGLSLEWKYLNYKTPNENSSRGQILPNATFSSINIFGPDVLRDFTSITRLNNELKLLVYFGKKILQGYAYLGLGPVFYDASNSIYVSSVHVPDGDGTHLISTSVKRHKIIWGGAAQLGYQYFLNSHYFINFCYTYLQTETRHFNNSINASVFNGFRARGPTILFLKRAIAFTVQDVTFSMNWVF